MARVNPKIFEPFIDPDKGEWIRIKTGTYENVVWRPVDMTVGDETTDGGVKIDFKIEFLEGPNFKQVEENDKQFETVCGKIIYDIFEEMAAMNDETV